jgi:hypothetical protein
MVVIGDSFEAIGMLVASDFPFTWAAAIEGIGRHCERRERGVRQKLSRRVQNSAPLSVPKSIFDRVDQKAV